MWSLSVLLVAGPKAYALAHDHSSHAEGGPDQGEVDEYDAEDFWRPPQVPV
jgi:hypothetical protein